MADTVSVTLPSYMTNDWRAPALAGPALAAVAGTAEDDS